MQRRGTLSSKNMRSEIIALDQHPTLNTNKNLNNPGMMTTCTTDNTDLSKSHKEKPNEDDGVAQPYAVCDFDQASHSDVTQPYSVQNLTPACAVNCSDDFMMENIVYESMDTK